MSKKVKVVGYCSVSTKEQTKQNQSIEKQKLEITKASKNLDVEIVKWFEATGGKNVFLNLQKAFEYCQDNLDVGYLFVNHVNRISRNAEQVIFWQKLFEGIGVVMTTFDPETKMPLDLPTQCLETLIREYKGNQKKLEEVLRGTRLEELLMEK